MFVSSTCYDLGQVRADLRDFAQTLGYEPVLSELDSFPVNPSIDTLSNCLAAVKDRADLFVLLVGGRYGSIMDSGLSITNLEYLEASAKGIPVFVFVKSDILTLLPTWRANPAAHFKHAVDTPRLFEFVEKLRSKDSVWVLPFNSAQDVTTVLRKQLSYLMSECLSFRSRLYPTDTVVQSLGPSSLRTYIEKPQAWEYLVLADLMRELIRSHESKLMDLELGISIGPVVHLDGIRKAVGWMRRKMIEVTHIPLQISKALESGLAKAVGPKGQPGDIRRIIHLANRFSDGYLEVINWTLEFRRVDVEEKLTTLVQLTSNLSANIISEMKDYAEMLRARIEEALANPPESGEVELTLTFTVPDLNAFESEVARLTASFK